MTSLSHSPSPTPPRIYSDREIDELYQLGGYKFEGITMGVCAMNKKVYNTKAPTELYVCIHVLLLYKSAVVHLKSIAMQKNC